MKQQLKYAEITLDREKSGPLYLQLTEELRHQIGMVCLNNSERLISERKLSEQLGVDRSTVNKAYAELLKEGLLTQRTPKTLCISTQSRRKLVAPFPNIGIIIPRQFSSLIEMMNGLSLQYIKGIIDSAAAKNISTIMIQLPDFEASHAEIDRFIDELARRLIGIIHLGGRGVYPDRPLEALMKYEKLPQIMISAYPQFPNVGTVTADPLTGGRKLAERLRSLGHKSVGIIQHSSSLEERGKDFYFCYEVYSRASKLLKIFEAYGLDCSERFHCFHCHDFYSTLKNLKKKKKEGNFPTAYWCINDETAHWTIHSLKKLDLQVPEDISVAGYDGISMPPEKDLTTICHPFYAIGSSASNLLLDYYENGKTESNSQLKIATSLLMKNTLGQAKENRNGKDGK